MLVQSPVAGDSRVLREAEALIRAGHTVHVLGRGVPSDFEAPSGVTFDSVGLTTQPNDRTIGVVRMRLIWRIARWLLLPDHRSRTERLWREAAAMRLPSADFDVVHAHDFNTLPLGVAISRLWSAPLIYDSHELWFGRALPGRPAPLQRYFGRRREARLATSAATVLTVSEGIAKKLRADGLRDVRVVRNTFPITELPEPQLRANPQGIAYVGRLGPGRDLEAVVEAARHLSPLRTVIVGPSDNSYRLVTDGVEAYGPMALADVDVLYRELGIALVTLTDSCENHRLALPNKLFHAVRAGVPVVAADLPELRSIVDEYSLGCVYQPGSALSLSTAVQQVVQDYGRYVTCIRNARKELSWERDAEVLLAVYRDLGDDASFTASRGSTDRDEL